MPDATARYYIVTVGPLDETGRYRAEMHEISPNGEPLGEEPRGLSKPGSAVFVTGHSEQAALANLTALWREP